MIWQTDRIKFHFVSSLFYFQKRTELKSFLLKLFKNEGYKVAAINYIFCTDEYLLKINQEYLHHDTYTDIVTFDFSKGQEPIVADIYISVERIRENSILYHSGFNKELHRVIFHGALHLSGYRDKTPDEATSMRNKEDYYLRKYFVPREIKTPKS